MKASHKLAEVMYKESGAAGGAAPGGAAGDGEGTPGSHASSGDDVIDAEYVDVDGKTD